MDTFIALLILACFALAFYAAIHLWEEYDFGERLQLKVRRICGRVETPLGMPLTHSCLKWIKTRQELLDHSTFCGIQETLQYDTHDYELRNCVHCGSTFTASRVPKFSTPDVPTD